METAISSEWTPLDLRVLVRQTKNEAQGYWIGKFEPEEQGLQMCNKTGVKGKQLKIGTREVWQEEIETDCYVVSYHDGMGKEVDYNDPTAVHFTVQEYGTKHGNETEYQSKIGDILISALDTVKNKRVIVDGIHRAAVMSSKHSKNSDYTGRIVYEWYGPNVKEIFPYDFMQFYRV